MSSPTLLEPVGAVGDLGPTDRREGFGWLAVAVAGFFVGEFVALLLAEAGVAITGTPGGITALSRMSVPPVWFVCCELVGLWVGFGGAALVVTRTGRKVGLRFLPYDVVFIALGLALQLAITAAYAPFHLKGFSKPVNHVLGGGSGWLLVIPACLTVFGAPLFEELYFRGVLLRSFLTLFRTRRAVLGTALAILVDGVLFGLAHLGSDSWVQLPGLAATGLVLALLAVLTGRLGPSIVTHASFNALAVLAFAVQR